MMKEGITGRWELRANNSYVSLEAIGEKYLYSFGHIGFPAHVEDKIDRDKAMEYYNVFPAMGYVRMSDDYEIPMSEGKRDTRIEGMRNWLKGIE